MTNHLQLSSTILATVSIFAACVLTLLVVGSILAAKMDGDDDGQY